MPHLTVSFPSLAALDIGRRQWRVPVQTHMGYTTWLWVPLGSLRLRLTRGRNFYRPVVTLMCDIIRPHEHISSCTSDCLDYLMVQVRHRAGIHYRFTVGPAQLI